MTKTPIFNPDEYVDDIEFKSAEEIRDFQDAKLRQAVKYLADNSKYYQRMFRVYGIDPSRIRTIDDLEQVPFTEKKDLQLFNEEFLCCDRSRIVDYITTSGTLGDPVTFGCTDSDLERLAYNEAKSFACAGLTSESVLQLMTTIDKRFMAGLAYFLGIRRLGAGIVRVGNGNPELQWDTIRRINPDTIMCVPSFILRLIEYARTHGIDWHKSSVRRIIGIGEGLRNRDLSLNLLGSRIASDWPEVKLFATYSSTEMGATFSECPCGCGGHVHPELIIVEIIGEDDRPVADGEVGEVVVTTLGVEGMPLLRFRTGDMAAKITEQCACGRNSYRLTPLVGRKHNMLKLKGTTIYPPAINDVLDNIDFVGKYAVVAETSDAGTDDVTVHLCLNPMAPDDAVKMLKDSFRSRLRVTPGIVVKTPQEMDRMVNPQSSRKPIKFIDRRKKS